VNAVYHSVTTVLEDGVGQITLNRPERMNSVTLELATELETALLHLGGQTQANVIVIRGAGGNFCAGGDFDEVSRLRTEGPAELEGLFVAFRRACDAIAAVEIPVVLAVEGVAAAGGFELMQAADIVLVSDTARISDNHIRFGMVPGGGSSVRLPRLIGRQQAMGLLLSGDRLSGIDAVNLGLAYRSFDPDEFDPGVEAFVRELAGRDRQAVATIKRLVYRGLAVPLQAALSAETDAVVRHISGGAGAASVDAFESREART
jgi:2-(1,2-epoxy-1,2-dihydrophenyl)acetyl-CoA isomerase